MLYIAKLQTDKESIIITKSDREVAQILPINTKKISLFGMLQNKAEIKANILEPVEEKWNAVQPLNASRLV
ncbi:type II toxin-antitoxin system Phd/YefM family antitoxin [Rickettsia rickettsii]|uniref:type II toxin-antitoxin system Phd/YefM family antitoxin n=1 Tax=Rickettsia rickettsii TaxID=783 RepID=UPI001E5B936F|nr:type II toxin-antitoxin system Phd/YefM family antitoxin [Rickettsia rickettsii]